MSEKIMVFKGRNRVSKYLAYRKEHPGYEIGYYEHSVGHPILGTYIKCLLVAIPVEEPEPKKRSTPKKGARRKRAT